MSQATLTLCFSGTDCWPDHGLVPRPADEINTYNPLSGYTPANTHQLLSRKGGASGTLPGCGTPYSAYRATLSVDYWLLLKDPQTPDSLMPVKSAAPSMVGDSLSGHSINILAAQAMTRIVGTRVQYLMDGLKPAQLGLRENPQGALVAQKLGLKAVDEMPRPIEGSPRLHWAADDLATLGDNPQSWETVNLIGHSRGGVVAIAVANLIALYLPHIRVNLIGLDPVPGTGNWPQNMCTLPASVLSHYVGIYAVDEVSDGFNAVVPAVWTTAGKRWDPLTETLDGSGLQAEQYQLIFSRGRHATIPGSRMSDGGDFDPAHISEVVGSVGDLVFYRCQQLLRQWGVEQADTVPASGVVAGLKTTINDHSATFLAMRGVTYGGALLRRHRARGVSSTAGDNPLAWSYLETFLPEDATAAQGFSGKVERVSTPHLAWQALTALPESDFGG